MNCNANRTFSKQTTPVVTLLSTTVLLFQYNIVLAASIHKCLSEICCLQHNHKGKEQPTYWNKSHAYAKWREKPTFAVQHFVKLTVFYFLGQFSLNDFCYGILWKHSRIKLKMECIYIYIYICVCICICLIVSHVGLTIKSYTAVDKS